MSKVKPILYMLEKGGISVLQTAIFDHIVHFQNKTFHKNLSILDPVYWFLIEAF